MITVKIGTNNERKQVIIDPSKSIMQTLIDEDIDTMGCTMQLNGELILGDRINDTFTDFGVRDGSTAMLYAVIKAESAR